MNKIKVEAIEICQKNLMKAMIDSDLNYIDAVLYNNQCWIMQALNIILEDIKEKDGKLSL